ncbi:MAG TPA: cadmium-translocating P-type ATPase [Candidatus Pelethocola excrementipullorum]|nr:cadmium-translocating P-type ATPase [Candidatus Pelethocola excrementipullorum]
MTKKVYIVENLDCANCAAAVERKIAAMPEVQEATLTFATKQLRITAENHESLLEKMRKTASAVEPGVEIHPRNRSTSNRTRSPEPAQSHDGCGCGGHEHGESCSHEHEHDKCCSHEHEHGECGSHEHEHGEPCSHEHHQGESSNNAGNTKSAPRKKSLSAENRRELLEVCIGALLFATGFLVRYLGYETVSIVLFILSYIDLGIKIVWTALKNLTRGKVFDENFLMSIATIGALTIQDYAEAAGVMLFYRIGELFEEIAVERSRSQIMDAIDMRPEVVTLINQNSTQVIPAEEAVVGDIIQIKPGDRIPLDGVITEGQSRIDTSPVTGEPVPVSAAPGDSIISGCINTSGLLKVRVEKVLEESMVTKILDSVENAAASKPQIERFISRFARIYTPFVVFLAIGTAIIPSLITGDWSYWVYTALTFLVISCPCALVLSVPLAFFSGIGAGSKKGILFKGGVSLEAMNNVKVVVMDKTGTITKGNFVLHEALPAEGTETADLLSLCASSESTSTHPIAHSIVSAAKSANLEIQEPQSVEELAGHGIRATLSEGEVLCGNRKLMDQFGIQTPSEDTSYGTEVFAALNGKYIGRLVISDTIKEDAKPAVNALRRLGIKTAMLTGDAADSAEAVAKETGIDKVYAKLLPQDKVSQLSKIRTSDGEVMFVGDGINDAPVLAGADVGAAMGSGADAAIEAADVVFMTSSMEAIPQSLNIARTSSRIARQNVAFALIIKALVMVLGLFGYANMWMAVFADTGVAMLCVLNSVRVLYKK